ncbi:MAG: SDR family NAD(P)-dependent oxidoreductase [Thermoplasmata archaeon]
MTYPDLTGKKVVITGGAGGIGLAAAKRFISEGSRVAILDSNRKALDNAISRNPGLVGIEADVSDPKSVDNAFVEVDEHLGGIDVLISNAGISRRRHFLDIKYEEWQEVINVNLGGMFLCAKQSIKRMIKKKSGVVLFTASTNGIEGHPLYASYNASKAGVILLAKTLALEFAPWLRVNAISPGYVLTPMQKAEYTEDMLQAVNLGIPMGRHATPEEIAALFAFLASDESRYVTGQSIVIDGGETAGQYIRGLEEH